MILMFVFGVTLIVWLTKPEYYEFFVLTLSVQLKTLLEKDYNNELPNL